MPAVVEEGKKRGKVSNFNCSCDFQVDVKFRLNFSKGNETLMKYLLFLYFTFQSFAAFPQEHHAEINSAQFYEVAVFLGLECPISQKYIYRLNDIYKKYENVSSLKWSFIIPGSVKEKKIKEFTKEYNVIFPVTSDDHTLSRTKYFGATVTPQVIIKLNGKTIYSGAIDNWFYELGRYRSQTTENYLVDALEAIITNKEPLIKETKAFGCFIEITSALHTDHQHD